MPIAKDSERGNGKEGRVVAAEAEKRSNENKISK
jgi:hypothetical protein